MLAWRISGSQRPNTSYVTDSLKRRTIYAQMRTTRAVTCRECSGMSLTACEYLRAWKRADTGSLCLNRRLVPGTCVLEILSMVVSPDLRYVFVDDFGYAVSYCRRRLWEDLTPPYERGSDESVERWRRLRAAFSLDELTSAWTAADAAFAELLEAFIAAGYSCELGDRLREIVFAYSLDLELGEIFVLPRDIEAILAHVGDVFAWQADGVRQPCREESVFDFADTKHRAELARWLREANQPA